MNAIQPILLPPPAQPGGGAAAVVVVPMAFTLAWVVGAEATPTLTAAARGFSASIQASSALPPARSFCPNLGWTDSAGGVANVDYAPLAVAAWSLFIRGDPHAPAVDALLFDDCLLSPDAINRTFNRLQTAGFACTARDTGVFMDQASQFVLMNRHDDFLLRAADLEPCDPAPGSVPAGGPSGAAAPTSLRDLTLGDLASPSGSYANCGLLEYFLAPRTVAQTGIDNTLRRFLLKSPCMKAVARLLTLLRAEDLTVKRMVAAKASPEEITEAAHQALVDFLSSLSCSATIIDLKMTRLNTADPSRLSALSTLVTWHFNPEQRPAVLAACFDRFVNRWEHLQAVVSPAPSAANAHRNTARLMLKFLPSAKDMCDATLDQLNCDLAAYVAVAKIPSTATDSADKRTELVLEALNRGTSAANTQVQAFQPGAPAAAAGLSKASTKGIVIDADYQVFINSAKVVELATFVAACLDKQPAALVAAITKVSRSRLPLVMRLLYNLPSLPGSKNLSRVAEARDAFGDAVSYALATEADASHKLVIMHGLADFELDAATLSKIQRQQFHLINPYDLLYRLAHCRLPSTAVLQPSRPSAFWASFITNSMVSVPMDKLFHVLGWDMGVFTAALAHAQVILTDATDFDEDDRADVAEHVSTAVTALLATVSRDYSRLLLSSSPGAAFPHDGKRLVAADDKYYVALAKLSKNMAGRSTEDSVFARKAGKRKAMEAAIAGQLPLNPLPYHPLHCRL